MTLQWTRRGRRRAALGWGVPALAALAAALLFARFPGLAPGCGFREATGIPCATCGGTRAAAALVSLRIRDALSVNPLVAAALLALWAGAAAALAGAVLGLPVPRFRGTPGLRFAVVLAAALALNWAYVLVRRG